jgi:hypothetical protein
MQKEISDKMSYLRRRRAVSSEPASLVKYLPLTKLPQQHGTNLVLSQV